MSTLERVLSVEGSGTALERRHRALSHSLQRCMPHATTFDRGAYDARAIERARAMWRVRMVSEHRSTSVFSGLLAQLIEANATMDTKALVLEMGQEELRHAEICGQVLVALGAEARCTADLAVEPLPQHRGCTPEERVMRNIIYGSCLSELVNAARFQHALGTITDPYVREVTRQLLADEVHHAQFGFLYLEAWRSWLERHADVRGSLSTYLRFAFATLEKRFAGKGREPPLTADERALGVTDIAVAREVFYDTIEHAAIPGLERFGIDAGLAWRMRSLPESR